jgi:hypothetical protein
MPRVKANGNHSPQAVAGKQFLHRSVITFSDVAEEVIGVRWT